MVADDPASRVLPIATEGEAASFEALARQAIRWTMHHRSVLDELLRLDMAIEHAGSVELNAAAFVPAKDLKSMLAVLRDNGRLERSVLPREFRSRTAGRSIRWCASAGARFTKSRRTR